MFMAWALIDAHRKGFHFRVEGLHYSWKEKFSSLPRVLPLLLIIAGMLFVLYGGVATPSEAAGAGAFLTRSEEHTSELQSLMRISYAVFCLKKKISYTYVATPYRIYKTM